MLAAGEKLFCEERGLSSNFISLKIGLFSCYHKKELIERSYK
jgi:hypothetical protein